MCWGLTGLGTCASHALSFQVFQLLRTWYLLTSGWLVQLSTGMFQGRRNMWNEVWMGEGMEG